MSDLFIPFNHQPTTTDVKTGSYTIPAGSYARVTMVHSDFTINSEAVRKTKKIRYQQSSTNLTFTPDSLCKVSIYYSGSGTLSAQTMGAQSLNFFSVTGSQMHNAYMSESDTITITHGTGSGVILVVGEYLESQLPTHIWAKSGDQLAGTSYYVELYNELT